jgi:site-specific DNA recombinase
MSQISDKLLVPRNGHTLIVLIVARISGCASQKEVSLEDQIDHGKEEVAELYQGQVKFQTIETKDKGEALDRPELAEVEALIRSKKLDLLVMEDVGRLVRGTAAVSLWGIAVDHGTRCIAPNDCIDTIDETWEEDLISACRDHVGHNAHTSKRIKKKLMNRFKKKGQAMALPIAGVVKPEDAKSYDDWHRDDSATPAIRRGLEILKTTLNCSAVAEYFSEVGFQTGRYCKLKTWDGAMVRRYYRNRLLAGYAGRGFRHTVKHHESGRRVSVKNTEGELIFYECLHLAHVELAELNDVNTALAAKNSCYRRPSENGVDPLFQRKRKRTQFPGQHARCWYCGWHYVWGGNGVTKNLMCSSSRRWRCWHSIGFDGPLAVRRIVAEITSAMYQLDGFDAQYAEMVQTAVRDREGGAAERWKKLERDELVLSRDQEKLTSSILEYGPRPMFEPKLSELDERQIKLKRERYDLESLRSRELQLPNSVTDLRASLETKFEDLAIDSFNFGDLMQQLVPEFHVYSVRLCDGGHLMPRARVMLDLAGSVADAEHVPGLKDLLTRVVTIDLFDRPPQRERVRDEAVRLAAKGLGSRKISCEIQEHPKPAAVDRSLALDRLMNELRMESPYLLVSEPPNDYPKLRRHRNPKYRFEPKEGYERPAL